MKFLDLFMNISSIHEALYQNAAKAINISITIRNWLIGYYIVEYEQNGEDKANFGEKLLFNLEKEFKEQPSKGFTERRLREYRQFYLIYPHISDYIDHYFKSSKIRQSLTAEIENKDNQSVIIRRSLTAELDKTLMVPSEKLVNKLSYTHLSQMLTIEEPLKRTFYEIECIKGNWSVRELKRQINSLYYERSGLSKNPDLLSKKLKDKAEELQPTDVIKNIYAFEFLGLPIKDVVEESDLEQALLDQLQEFLLEMGTGFCLEGRQKRVLIGGEYYFIDLVFYHRILKCHVLVDLKIKDFQHYDAGQLNTYLNYYKTEVMQTEDNHPVGILLVTDKNKTLAEYATASLNHKIFVQKYLLNLPSKNELENFIKNELKKF